MIDLYVNARPDERFHVQQACPQFTVKRIGPLKKVSWSNLLNPNGDEGWFVSYSLWGWQYYHGSTKCDGSRTMMLRNGQLGGTASERTGYVMTSTPKELLAFRHHAVSDSPSWDNMGGS